MADDTKCLGENKQRTERRESQMQGRYECGAGLLYICRVMKEDFTDKVESEHKSRERQGHDSVIASANTKTLIQECDWIL